jgi:glycogen synthase
VKILLVSDVFPPKCGGSGWSTYYLAEALIDRGHETKVVVPKANAAGEVSRFYGRVTVLEYHFVSPGVPFLRSLAKGPVFYPGFERFLDREIRSWQPDVIHAQHSMSVPPAVVSGRRNGVPVVSTVRDYWPLCHFGTMVRGESICSGCSTSGAAGCLVGRYGPLGVAGTLLLPVLAADLNHKQRCLVASDIVTAVSRCVRSTLEGIVPEPRLRTVPNGVDTARITQIARVPALYDIAGPYLLYVGKLELTKGAGMLVPTLERLESRLPLVVVGEGSLRADIQAQAKSKGLDVRFTGWVDNDESLRLMANCEALLFPSVWPEPLSRVLLEAMAVGAPTVAMDTGGTADIIDGSSGLLCGNLDDFVKGVNIITEDASLRDRLRTQARRKAVEEFDLKIVASQVENIYQEVRR